MREAAAEGPARADRVMCDVVHDKGQKLAQRPLAGRAMKGRVPHASPDAQHAAFHGENIKTGHAIDIDKMRRPRQTECHCWDETLPASQNAAIVTRDLRQRGNRIFDCFRRVIGKRRRLHDAGRLR